MRNEADLSKGLKEEAEKKKETKSDNGCSIVESQCHGGESVAVEFAREEEEEEEEKKKWREN
jgi:hypothetical protein